LYWKLRVGDWRSDNERRAIYRYIEEKKARLVEAGWSKRELADYVDRLKPKGTLLARARQRMLNL
jgi:hypothetical protein